jgi:hypothetical protein
MTVKELKVILEDVPDHWLIVFGHLEGDCYQTQGAHGDEEKGELLIEPSTDYHVCTVSEIVSVRTEKE